MITDEMKNILESNEKHIVVQAFAGTGKTQTMIEYIKKYPNEKILFLVYNKSMANDFNNRLSFFNNNCVAKTIHSLAYKWFIENYENKKIRNFTVLDIKNFFKNYYFDYFDLTKIKYYFNMYLTSNVKNINDLELLIDTDRKYLKFVKDLWKFYTEKSDYLSHNIYLKLFQLSQPIIDYDTIIVDEFNDVNLCMLDIIANNLDKKIIVVGDSYQMINGFNFNVDGLKIMKEQYKFKEYKLTNSFRINEEIAQLASDYLSKMYNKKILFHGLGKTKIVSTTNKNLQTYILCRTKIGGLQYIYKYITNNPNSKVYYIGGLDKFNIKEIEKIINSNGMIYLCGKRYHVNELKLMISKGLQDMEIQRIVTTYYLVKENPDILVKIKKSMVDNIEDADIILTTAHASKGLTLSNVVLADDFTSMDLFENEIEEMKSNIIYNNKYCKNMINSEINLRYVALTRPNNTLNMNVFKNNYNYEISDIDEKYNKYIIGKQLDETLDFLIGTDF